MKMQDPEVGSCVRRSTRLAQAILDRWKVDFYQPVDRPEQAKVYEQLVAMIELHFPESKDLT